MTCATTFVLRPPPRQTLTGSVTESLREAIFAGIFSPGERVAEATLGKRLEVSRAPIREALATLEQEGLVSRSPAGTFVCRLSRDDAIEICTFRHALELLAMRLALAQPNLGLCDALAANLDETRGAIDPRQLARLDLEFHEIIVRAAGHNRLLSTWLNLRSQIRLMMTQRNLTDSRSHAGTIGMHQELLALIRATDCPRTVALLECHLQSQYEWIMRSFDEAPSDASMPADDS